MHAELTEDGNDQAPVEDGDWRPLFVQSFEWLGETEEDEEETDAHAHVGCLVITHLDTVEIESTHCVC